MPVQGFFDEHSKRDKEEARGNAEDFTYYFILGWLQSKQENVKSNPSKRPLYHATTIENFRKIVYEGLLPKNRSYDWEDWNEYLFLSNIKAVPIWFRWSYSNRGMENVYKIPTIILRTYEYKKCKEDYHGTRDSGYPAFMCLETIKPEYLEVWNGEIWKPIEDLTPGEIDDLEEDFMYNYNNFVERFL